MQVAERRREIDGRIACITFAEPPMLAGFERKMELPYPIYGDPQRRTYDALGLGRASAARVWLDPRVWWRYARLLAAGSRHRAAEEAQDTRQLGGDAVLDAHGRVAWIYRSSGPEDRPSVDDVVAAVRAAADGHGRERSAARCGGSR